MTILLTQRSKKHNRVNGFHYITVSLSTHKTHFNECKYLFWKHTKSLWKLFFLISSINNQVLISDVKFSIKKIVEKLLKGREYYRNTLFYLRREDNYRLQSLEIQYSYIFLSICLIEWSIVLGKLVYRYNMYHATNLCIKLTTRGGTLNYIYSGIDRPHKKGFNTKNFFLSLSRIFH